MFGGGDEQNDDETSWYLELDPSENILNSKSNQHCDHPKEAFRLGACELCGMDFL